MIQKRLRALTVFGQHDLAQRAPFPHLDLVLCRNVLIYFTNELQAHAPSLHLCAARGGYLVLGKAESSGQLSDYFTLQDKAQKVYRRHGERLLMPPPQIRELHVAASHRLALTQVLASAVLFPPIRREREPAHSVALQETALMKLPVGLAVVNEHYDIQFINSLARRYFSIHGPAVGGDLIHLASGIPSAKLRAGHRRGPARG